MRAPDPGVAAWHADPRWAAVPTLHLDADPGWERLVVVAAHPDDESLGAGGLIAEAHRRGVPLYLVLLTAGEASWDGSASASRRELATLRLQEMDCAVERLAPGAPVVFLGAEDGEVAALEDQVTSSLTEMIGQGARTLVAAPWRHDGHPDHDAAGRAAAAACAATSARLLEYPLRLWLDQQPADAPWEHLVRLCLPESDRVRKTEAIHCHTSQVRPPDDLPDRGLKGRRLAHFTTDLEHYVETPIPDDGPSDGPPGAPADVPEGAPT